jgi:hypothetical protein
VNVSAAPRRVVRDPARTTPAFTGMSFPFLVLLTALRPFE